MRLSSCCLTVLALVSLYEDAVAPHATGDPPATEGGGDGSRPPRMPRISLRRARAPSRRNSGANGHVNGSSSGSTTPTTPRPHRPAPPPPPTRSRVSARSRRGVGSRGGRASRRRPPSNVVVHVVEMVDDSIGAPLGIVRQYTHDEAAPDETTDWPSSADFQLNLWEGPCDQNEWHVTDFIHAAMAVIQTNNAGIILRCAGFYGNSVPEIELSEMSQSTRAIIGELCGFALDYRRRTNTRDHGLRNRAAVSTIAETLFALIQALLAHNDLAQGMPDTARHANTVHQRIQDMLPADILLMDCFALRINVKTRNSTVVNIFQMDTRQIYHT